MHRRLPNYATKECPMNPRILSISVAAVSMSLFFGCKKKSSEPAPATAADVSSSANAADQIVVTQRTAVTTDADAKSKQLALVQPGEVMTFLGDSTDSPAGKNEQFYKVKLSDGTEGWARNYGLILGQAGAILVEAPIYQRPTTLAPTRQKLRIGQLVGVQGTQDNFVRVAASKWQAGWIDKSALSNDGNDILAAALAGAAIGKKTGKEALVAQLAALSGKSSAVATALQAKLDSLNGAGATPAPEAPMESTMVVPQ